MDIRVYKTMGCHLCDDAIALLAVLRTSEPEMTITEVDIADSNHLIRLYGEKIPVVQLGEQDLCWPFSLEELRTFIHLQK
ncbi:MAG: glutaredoxin family protein [Pseudomonadota bacterium]|nr:glutaredoxin family protein [Pseudomonadota bacterium]